MAKKNKGLTVIIALVAVIAICAAGFFGYNYIGKEINGKRNIGSGNDVYVYINDGSEQYDVGVLLYNCFIIGNETIWTSWMDKHYPDMEFTGGEYMLNSHMSYEEIAAKLGAAPDVSHKSVSVCIPEGYNVFKIAEELQNNGVCGADEFLEECKSAEPYLNKYDFLSGIPSKNVAYQLEGFLFPATYDFVENEEPSAVVDEMLRAFEVRIADEWTDYCTKNNMSLYELITLASVVEKETLGDGVAENIASVFINRLNKSSKLQSDVTIDYGNALRAAGFNDDVVTSYNTYKCDALPSGPICNPGVDNINAVVNHNDTGYFYFFSYNNGADFYFTDNYDDFQKEWARLGSTNTN